MRKLHRNAIRICCLLILLTCALVLNAHNINYALEKAPVNDIVLFYLALGVRHIIPEGIDHILFIVGICLLATNIRTIFFFRQRRLPLLIL